MRCSKRAWRTLCTARASPLHLIVYRFPVLRMETDWYNRAEAIQQRITQLKDSL